MDHGATLFCPLSAYILLTEPYRMVDAKDASSRSDVEKWGAVEAQQEDIRVFDELEEKRYVIASQCD